MECPKCGLINPSEALRCDCGYDFLTKTVQSSYLDKRIARPNGKANMLIGAAGLVLPFTLLTTISYRAALEAHRVTQRKQPGLFESQGVWIIAVVIGIIVFMRGRVQYLAWRSHRT